MIFRRRCNEEQDFKKSMKFSSRADYSFLALLNSFFLKFALAVTCYFAEKFESLLFFFDAFKNDDSAFENTRLNIFKIKG